MARNWRKAEGASALAKGLRSAGSDLLFGGDGALRDTVSLRLSDVVPNPHQPRRFFDEAELQQLAASLQSVGQLSPILVKPHPTEARRYFLIAGERRWRAAGIAGLGTIAAHILSDESDVDQIALIENLQRVNLSPVEEAEGMQRLIDRHGYSQEQVGALLSRSRTEVNTTLTLLRLDEGIRRDCVTSHSDLPKALLLEIARMEPADQTKAWAQAKDGALTARAARAARKGADAPTEGASVKGGAPARPSAKRFIAALPKLQAKLQDGLEAGLTALETERPALGRQDAERLKAFRDRLDAYQRMIDRILDGGN